MSLSKSVGIAVPFAQRLSEANIRLAMPGNSDFLALIRSSMPDNGLQDKTALEPFLSNLSNLDDSGEIFNEYQMVRSALKDNLVRQVKDHIAIAREVVGVVKLGVERICKYRETLPDSSAVGRFTILKDPLPEITDTDYFQELVSSPANQFRNQYATVLSTPRTEEALNDCLSGLDAEVRDSFMKSIFPFSVDPTGRPRRFLEDVFNGFFTGMTSQGKNYNWQGINLIPAGERILVAFVIYVMAEHFNKEVPADAQGSLGEFNSTCLDMLQAAKNILINAFEEKKYQVEKGMLILVPHYTEDSVVVDKSVYDAFLEAGGMPELVLGCKTGNLGFSTALEITTNAERCAQVWSQFASLLTSTADNEEREYLRAAYKATFSELLEEGPAFEAELRKANPTMAGKAAKEAFAYIDSLAVEQLRNAPEVMEVLIGEIRFGYTAAKLFIKNMRGNKKDNPLADQREDATVATIKYLVAYVLTQIAVVNV